MRAGIARIDLTPEPAVGVYMSGYTNSHDKPSEGAHDPLFARVLLLDDGRRRIALVALDLIGLNPGRLPGMARNLGVDGLLLAASHTHGGPMVIDLEVPYGEDRHWPEGTPYLSWVEERIAEGIAQAKAALQPVRLSVGRGAVDLSFNRRLLKPDGSVEMIWGQNRERRRPFGPADPEVGVVRVDGLEGQPVALFCHYACHPVVLGPENRWLTADFPGYACAYLERQFPGALALFLQGGCGDLDPYVDVQNDFDPAREQGEVLGREVARVARERGVALEEEPWLELIRLSRECRRYYKPEERCRIEYSVLRVGRDLAFLNLPGEPFVELQLELKRRSTLPHTFLLGYVNGYAGYFPTLQANREGGYGASSGGTMHVEAAAGEAMVAEALAALR
ncbi:MAG: neutral/alkaline non-lysosomal ceramidase N-terminal domain-containing protein [Candidatus Handelsmanbacteria bacterium]|nr:neutral/alkaline non-lysosomal ceramidase N-terminal domain-containing protein [Candidatus Handelsmanbacteria bacterium]